MKSETTKQEIQTLFETYLMLALYMMTGSLLLGEAAPSTTCIFLYSKVKNFTYKQAFQNFFFVFLEIVNFE